MNNTAVLTAGNAIYSRKRAKKRARVEEITFDPEQRKDYLTGFRKRKTQRQQKAAEHAKEQARKERIETRKEIREARKAEVEQRLKAVNAQLDDGNDGEHLEVEDKESQVQKDPIWENHFEDEEKTTTVTIIEDFDQGGLENVETIPKPQSSAPAIQPPLSTKTSNSINPKKKKAFRYGTKAERQSDRRKAKLKQRNQSRQKRK